MQTEELKIPSLEDFFNDTPQTEETEQPNDIFFEQQASEPDSEPEDSEIGAPRPKGKQAVTEEPVSEPAPPKQESISNSFYSELIKDFINDGDWIDGQIEIDGQPFILSELENVDKTTFLKIKKGQQVAKEEREKGKYISVEDLDETDLKLIEIRKAKGDVRELLQFQSEVLHPLQGLDLENLDVQRNIVYHKYKNKGIPDGVIRATIADLEANFKLDVEAAECVNEINAVYKQKVDEQLRIKQEEAKQEEENTKVYRKNSTEAFKAMGLKESVIKNFVDSATVKNKQGLTKADELFLKAKQDPEFFNEIIFLLNDPKGYKEYLGAGIKNKTALDTFIKISSTEKKATSTTTKEEAENTWDEYFKIKQ